MKTQKTTVYLGTGDYREIKSLARARGCAPAALVREAVAEYAARHAPKLRPKSIGIAASRRRDISERAEDLLKGLGRR
jgi:hypothetical protein